jgi:hypothetical protein
MRLLNPAHDPATAPLAAYSAAFVWNRRQFTPSSEPASLPKRPLAVPSCHQSHASLLRGRSSQYSRPVTRGAKNALMPSAA